MILINLDPIYNSDVHKLENIQRRAARWVLKDYSRYSSITSMLQHLSWPELKTRCKISRLQTFYKALHNQIPLSILFQWPEKPGNIISTISYSLQHLLQLTKKVFSRTAQDWNLLPQFLIDLNDSDSFSVNVSNYCSNVHVWFFFPERISSAGCSVIINK